MMNLVTRCLVRVRFNEVDSMGIVWHGNYIKYLEEGREHFGRTYGISYLDVMKAGLRTPIVSVEINYKRSLKYGDVTTIETRYEATETPKLVYNYTIFNQQQEIMCTARTVQVFVDEMHRLQLILPPFVAQWRERCLQNYCVL